jgi:hypothetical protein
VATLRRDRFGGVKNECVHRHEADAWSGDVVTKNADVASDAVDLHRFLREFGHRRLCRCLFSAVRGLLLSGV